MLSHPRAFAFVCNLSLYYIYGIHWFTNVYEYTNTQSYRPCAWYKRPHTTSPQKVAEEGKSFLFQGNWWNIIIWPDICNLLDIWICCSPSNRTCDWTDLFDGPPRHNAWISKEWFACRMSVQSKKGKSGPQIIGYGTSRDPLKLACRMLIRTTSTVDAWWKNLQEVALPRNTFSLKIIFSFEPRITHDSIQYYTDYSEERCLWRLQL